MVSVGGERRFAEGQKTCSAMLAYAHRAGLLALTGWTSSPEYIALPLIRRGRLKGQEESCKEPAGDRHPGVAPQQDALVILHALGRAGPAPGLGLQEGCTGEVSLALQLPLFLTNSSVPAQDGH